MARKTILLILAFGLLAAPALAASSTRNAALPEGAESVPGGAPLLVVVPCIILDATVPDPAGEPRRAQGTYPPICNFPVVRLNLTANDAGGVGELVLNLRAPGAAGFGLGGLLDKRPPPDLAMQTQSSHLRPVATLLPGAPSTERIEEEAERTRTVSLAFQATWGIAHCRAPTGRAAAEVDGSATVVQLPTEAYTSLCRLAQDPAASALPHAAAFSSLALGAVAATDREVARDLQAVRAGLATLHPSGPEVEPPAAPAAPQDPVEVASVSTADLSVAALPVVRSETDACAAGTCVELAVGPGGTPPSAAPGTGPVPALSAAAVAAPASAAGPGADSPPPLPPAVAPGPERAGPTASPTPAAVTQSAPLSALAAGRSAADPGPPALLLAGAAALSLLALLGVGLYQRLARPRALDHPARAALYAAVGAQARTAGEAADLTGMERKTAEYHLVYLVRLGLLREAQGEGGVRRFAQPTVRTAPAPEDLANRVLAAVGRTPGAHASGLAASLGVTRARLDRCVKDLLLAGRLDSRPEGGARRLYVVVGNAPNL